MKLKFAIIIYIILIFSCSIIEPSKLLVKNESDYTIIVNVSESNKKNVKIQKNNGCVFYVNPGDIKVSIEIEEFCYKKEYNLSICYLENKQLKFDINFNKD